MSEPASSISRTGVWVRLLGLLVAVWGTVIAVVGVYGYSPSVSSTALSSGKQVAQVAANEELQQPLSRESRPEINSDVNAARLEQLGRGWSISVDSNVAEQARNHNPRIMVGQLDLLQQVVPLRLQAENVRQITPVIRDEATLTEMRLSPAQEVSDGMWVHDWSVEEVPAGTYRVQIEIEPDEGSSYMAYDGNVYRLPTYAQRDAALAAGRASVEGFYDSLEEIRAAINNRSRSDSQSALHVINADRARGVVPVYLESNTPALLQVRSPDGSWQAVGEFVMEEAIQAFSLDTTEYVDGWYALRAVELDTQSVITAVQSIRINNALLPAAAGTDTRAVDERVRRGSALSTARINVSRVLTERDVATTDDISAADHTEATRILQTLWAEYRHDINQFSDELATALRTGEEQSINRARQRFQDLEADIVSGLDGRRQVVINAVQKIVRNRLNERILRVEQAERYVALFVSRANNATTTAPQDSVLSDTAVSFYALSTSSDVAAEPEYQEPRTAGVTRDDLLQVQTIATTTTASTTAPTGILRGTALPNTTIRLFIYSNPVVVTLNTNSDGTWEYQFDTELADGEHEVYVALTDGVGQVIARSNPFRFTKTAQAFSPVDRITAGQVSQSNQTGVSLMNWPLIYLIVALSIVVIGFLIMLVGATIRSREDKHVVVKTKILP